MVQRLKMAALLLRQASRSGTTALVLCGVLASHLPAPATALTPAEAEGLVKESAKGTVAEQLTARSQLARVLQSSGKAAKAAPHWQAVLTLFERGNFSRNGSPEANRAAEATYWLGRTRTDAAAKARAGAVGKKSAGKSGDRALTTVLQAATAKASTSLLGNPEGTGPADALRKAVDVFASPSWTLAAASEQARLALVLADLVLALPPPSDLPAAELGLWRDVCAAEVRRIEAFALGQLRPAWEDLERRAVDSPWRLPAKQQLSRLAPDAFAVSRLRQTDWQTPPEPAGAAALAPLLTAVHICYDAHLALNPDEVLGEVTLQGVVTPAGRVELTAIGHSSKEVQTCIGRRAAGLNGLAAGTPIAVRLEFAAL